MGTRQMLLRVALLSWVAAGHVWAQGVDNCADGPQVIAGDGVFAFDNTTATVDGAGDALCLDFDTDQFEADVWYCWTAICSGTVVVNTCNQSSVDTRLAAYDGCNCAAPILACVDDNCGLQSTISFAAVGGQSYLLRVGTFPGAASGTGTITIETSPACACQVDADCDDGNPCNGAEVCDTQAGVCVSGSCSDQVILVDATFDTDADGFAYQDDTFRGTNNPALADGSYDGTGGQTGGGLVVDLGPQGSNMSGGWGSAFDVVGTPDSVEVELAYRLLFPGDYDPGDIGQALLSVDGTLIGVAPDDYLLQFNGAGGTTTTVFERRIGNDIDDADESFGNGDVKTDRSKIELGKRAWGGMYFRDVQIPAGANIVSAVIEMVAYADDNELTDLRIYGEANGTPALFNNTDFNLSSRSRTADAVDWLNVEPYVKNATYFTPDIAPVIQEIVNRGDWTSGNPMAILVESLDPDGERRPRSHDKEPAEAPLLRITYGSDQDSGWLTQTFTLNLASGTHQLTVGGFNNASDAPAEITEVRFDDIRVTAQFADTCQCTDDNECTIDVCSNGQCRSTPDPGATCDDGDACTENDTCDGNGGCAGTPIVGCGTVDLAVTKTVDDDAPTTGDPVVFTITVANTGTVTATGIEVTDVLTTGLNLVNAVASQGTYAGGTGLWDVGSVAGSDSASLTLNVLIDNAACGDLTNVATLTAVDQDDSNSGDDSAAVTITVVDTTPPTLSACPPDVTTNSDLTTCGVTLNLTAPTGTDNCSPTVTVTETRSQGQPGDLFPPGTTVVTYTATDDAGLTSACTTDVTVMSVNTLVITVELEDVSSDLGVVFPIQRCISFVMRSSGQAAAMISSVGVFVAPASSTANAMHEFTVNVPCGNWDEVCVKDDQHSLTAVVTVSAVGTRFEADSVAYLRGGDTNNDGLVDGSDSGYLIANWLSATNPTSCPYDGTRDADFNANGVVFSEDFVILSTNFFQGTGRCVPPAPVIDPGATDAEPRPWLGREQLARQAASWSTSLARPASELIKLVDHNRDLMFDYRDVALFERSHGLDAALSQRMRAVTLSPDFVDEYRREIVGSNRRDLGSGQ